MKLAAGICAAWLVAGCVSMSESDCRATNWYERGAQDGLMGMQAQIDVYTHQCAAFAPKPEAQQYMDGWRVGYAEWNRRVQGARF
jgi:hypothetical protein